MKHSELRHQPRHVNPRIQVLWIDGTVSMRHKMNCCFIYNVKMELF